jgi:predicted 3-demethylubiquinone-9 3-methyltransferase (glyoxalase superfamily)
MKTRKERIMSNEAQRIIPFLTFHGNAEEAINYYAANLPGAKIETLTRYEEGQGGDAGKVLAGILSLFGQHIQFMDMNAAYECPPFSWSTSLLVNCADEAEFDTLFNALADGGTVMMKEDDFMQYRKVSWVTDRFGITWQPVLE